MGFAEYACRRYREFNSSRFDSGREICSESHGFVHSDYVHPRCCLKPVVVEGMKSLQPAGIANKGSHIRWFPL